MINLRNEIARLANDYETSGATGLYSLLKTHCIEFFHYHDCDNSYIYWVDLLGDDGKLSVNPKVPFDLLINKKTIGM